MKSLSQIFGERSSLFNTRFQCLQLYKRESDDFVTNSSIGNREFGCLQLGSLTEDQFKCLICICGLQILKDLDIRFDIHYRRTINFGQADVLSRLICNHQEPEKYTVMIAISIDDNVGRQLSDAMLGIPLTAADIHCATEQYPVLRQASTYVQTSWLTTALTGDLHQLFLRRASLSLVDSCLMFVFRMFDSSFTSTFCATPVSCCSS
ncbi:unnamed protein product [Dibothriocephalus latus]|uniref:Uncharacterized protein n=1 Tax=Dibothriocephalus latus TaxID=60516 RepID=A0A3P7NV71_DIBLA|nr:unnamed protein product [Dibothriocephalus latus]